MKQISNLFEPVMLHIDYEMDRHRNHICDNPDHLQNILELMFGFYVGSTVYKILQQRGSCTFPTGERDGFFEEHLNVVELTAEFNYTFPDSKLPDNFLIGEPEEYELSKSKEIGQE